MPDPQRSVEESSMDAVARSGKLQPSLSVHALLTGGPPLVLISIFALVLTPHTDILWSAESTAAITSRIDANRLAEQVVENELKAQVEDKSLWKYREILQRDGKARIMEVVQTNDGEIGRLIAVNGEPLSAQQRQAENQRIEKLVSKRAQLQENQKNRNEDAAKEKKLLQMLPEAFRYEYADGQDGYVKLRFRPNPRFHPNDHEAEVFHHMEGVMWVDISQKRLAGLEGRLTSEVKFGGGLLGHLDKGGTFSVKQRDIGTGHWRMTSLDIQMNGRALLWKTIAVREKENDSDFQEIPRNTTLEGAAKLLEQDTVS
jgi:hypothetical protein